MPRFVIVFVPGLIVLAACAGGNAASKLVQAPTFEPKGQTKCGVAKSQDHPLIVEWPSSDRLELESKVHQRLAVVHYVGCEMRVLPRCSGPSKYNYQAGTRKEDRVEMTDSDELYAHLPVGAPELEGKLQRSGKLTVNMNLVGRYEAVRASVRAEELQGECSGATHFVYGISVGAFDFYSGGGANVGGGASLGRVSAQAHSEAARDTVSKDGDTAACAKATTADTAPPEGCGALVRIDVVPIMGAATPAATPGGSAQRTLAWVTGGAGVAGVAVGGVLAATGSSSFQSPTGEDHGVCTSACQSAQSNAHVRVDVGLALAGVGAALVVTSGVLWLTNRGEGNTASTSPRVGVTLGGAVIGGAF